MSALQMQLPDNWYWVDVRECFTLRTEVFRKQKPLDSGYLLYTPQAFDEDKGPIEVGPGQVPPTAVLIERGDVLWSPERVWIVVEPSVQPRVATREFIPLQVSAAGRKHFSLSFLRWVLQAPRVREQFRSAFRGERRTHRQVWNTLAAVQLSCPPSQSDQEAIVHKLESAQTALFAARSHAELAQRNSQSFLQSVLETEFSLGEDVFPVPLHMEATVQVGVTPPGPHSASRQHGALPVFTADSIDEGQLTPKVWSTLVGKVMCQKGDLLFCARGVPNGWHGLAPEAGIVGDGLFRITTQRLSARWLGYFLRSRIGMIRVGRGDTGVNVRKRLERLEIPFAGSRSHQSTVEYFDRVSVKSSELVALSRDNLRLLSELQRSLIDRACRGDW